MRRIFWSATLNRVYFLSYCASGAVERLHRIYVVKAVNYTPDHRAFQISDGTLLEIEAKLTLVEGIASATLAWLLQVLDGVRKGVGHIGQWRKRSLWKCWVRKRLAIIKSF